MSDKGAISTCTSSICTMIFGIIMLIMGFVIIGIILIVSSIISFIGFLARVSTTTPKKTTSTFGGYSKSNYSSSTKFNYGTQYQMPQVTPIVTNKRLSLTDKISKLMNIGMPNDHIPIILDIDHFQLMAALRSGKINTTNNDMMVFSTPISSTQMVLGPNGIQNVPVRVYPKEVTEKGVQLLAQGQIQLAIASFQKALQQEHKFIPALIYMGLAFGQIGQHRIAIEWLERANQLDPGVLQRMVKAIQDQGMVSV